MLGGLSLGSYESMMLKQDGSAWTTGWTGSELSTVRTAKQKIFKKIVSGGAQSIAAGNYHVVMLKQGGSVWTKGSNVRGQLGDGGHSYRSSFVQVVSSGVMAVCAGLRHSIILKKDSSVWAAGYNVVGALGDGSTFDRDSFIQVDYSHQNTWVGRCRPRTLRHTCAYSTHRSRYCRCDWNRYRLGCWNGVITDLPFLGFPQLLQIQVALFLGVMHENGERSYHLSRCSWSNPSGQLTH